jgi:hypothetical protein
VSRCAPAVYPYHAVVRITGEEAAVINIAIGAALAWSGAAWNQWRTSRHAGGEARTNRRRDAYAALIIALDHLERAWTAGETLESEYLAHNMGQITGEAVREIHRAYVTVLLAGSDEASAASGNVGPVDDAAESFVVGVVVPPDDVPADHAGLFLVAGVVGAVEREVPQRRELRLDAV